MNGIITKLKYLIISILFFGTSCNNDCINSNPQQFELKLMNLGADISKDFKDEVVEYRELNLSPGISRAIFFEYDSTSQFFVGELDKLCPGEITEYILNIGTNLNLDTLKLQLSKTEENRCINCSVESASNSSGNKVIVNSDVFCVQVEI